MGARPEIKPEDCPEPFWHDTHYYCPVCTWVAPDAPRSAKVTPEKLDEWTAILSEPEREETV